MDAFASCLGAATRLLIAKTRLRLRCTRLEA